MEPQSHSPTPEHSTLGRTIAGLGALVAVLVGLVLLIVFALQTGWGKARVQTLAQTQLQNLLAENATVEIGELGGSIVTNAWLTNLVFRQNGIPVIRVDSARASYNLAALARGRLALGDVVLVDPFVRLEQRADSSFNLQALFAPDTTAADTTGGLTITLDDLRVESGRVEVAFYTASGRDSLLTAAPLGLRLSDFTFAPDRLAGTFDTLTTTLTAADRTTALDLALAGRFDDEAAAVDTLRLTSPRSDVSGHAEVQYAAFLDTLADTTATAPADWLPRFTADLVARPLSLADVRAFVPLDAQGSPTLTLDAESDGSNLTTFLDADLDGAGTVDLAATFRSPESGRVVYRAEGAVRALDPGKLLGEPALAAQLNADLDVALEGASNTALDGAFALRVFDSSVGEQAIESSALTGRFTDGQTRFDLNAAIPGAVLTATGTARPFATTPTYFAEGTFADVNLAAFADSLGPTSLGGTFSIAGQGIDPQTLQASLGATLGRATIATPATTTEVEQLALDAQFSRGTLRYNLRAEFGPDGRAGGGLDVAGTAQPFATPLAYAITEGRADELDLAALTGDATQASSLTGTFTLDGRGTDPQTLALDLQAAFDDTRYGSTRIPAADLFATLQNGLLAFDGEVDLGPEGRLEARGQAQPFADTLSYTADALLSDFNAGAFGVADTSTVAADTTTAVADASTAVADTTAFSTRLNATVRVDGRGTDPQTLALVARAQLTDSQVNRQPIESGDIAVQLTDGTLYVDGTVTTPSGLVRLDATGQPFAPTPAFTVRDGRFENLDLGAFAGNPRLSSDLTGQFNANYTGESFETGTLQGVLRFAPSSFNEAPLDGTLSFALDDGLGQANADLAVAGGTLVLDGDLRLKDGVPAFDIAGRVDSVRLGPFLEPVLASLPDSVRRARPDRAARDVLSLTFDVEAGGNTLETFRARGQVQSPGARLLGIRVDTLFARFAFADQQLDLERLTLNSQVLDFRADGEVAFDDFTQASSLLTFSADIKDTAPISALLGQNLLVEGGHLQGEINSEPGRTLRYRLDATTDLVAVGPARVSDASANVAGVYSREEGSAVRVRLETGFFSAATFQAREVDLDARYDGDNLALDAMMEIDGDRDLRVEGRSDLDPYDPQLTIERFDLRLGPRSFALAQPARVTYGEEIRVRNFLLSADTPGLGVEQIAADGVIDLDGRQDFIITVEGLVLEELTDLVGFDALGGELDASLVLGGTAAAPTVEGSIAITPITSRDRTVGTVDAEIAYADQRLELDAVLTHVSGAELRTQGFVPMGFTLDGSAATPPPDAPVDLALTTTAPFPIAWAAPFLDPQTVSELGGTLSADAAIVGTRTAPQLDGQALLADGRLGIPALGHVYTGATIPLTFDGDRLTLGSDSLGQATLRGERGALTADGALLVPNLQFGALTLDLTIEADNYLVIDTQTYRDFRATTLGEALRVEGPVDGPSISGRVRLDQGDVYQTEELVGPTYGDVVLSTADIQRVESTFGVRAAAADTTVSAIYEQTALDLTVEIPGNVWYRSRQTPGVDIEFEGALEVNKERGAEDVQLFNTIEIRRGAVELSGRRFEVERGVFVFNGPIPETRVDLAAEMVIRQTGQATADDAVTITLNYEGILAENPAPSFSSSPVQLETSDIVCYIATGQPCRGILTGGGEGSLGETAVGFGLGQLSTLVEGVAGQSLGLDLVQIEATPDVRVTIGKYLSNRLFATLGYLVSNNAATTADAAQLSLVLQYQLRRWLQLQAEYDQLQDGESNVGGGVQFEVSY